MGWAAYKFTRTNKDTGAIIGDIIVIFPKVARTISIASGDYTMSQLLAINDFPVEAHIFATPRVYDDLSRFGFGNIFNVKDYVSEKWVLDNNSYITFTYRESPDGGGTQEEGAARFYTSAGGLDLNVASSHWYPSSNIGNFSWGFCIVGEMDGVGLMPQPSYKPPIRHITISSKAIPYVIYDEYLEFFAGATPIIETHDPYNKDDETEPGGGTGDFDGTSDSVDIPSLPTLSATDAGFITLFNPTLAQLRELSSYMWSDLFNIDGWKKIFADPMNAILGLSIVPVDVPSSSARPLAIGNISTGISINVADTQFIQVDCGMLNVKEFWGAYLDYAPYTKAEIYLPYIGIRPLSVDDVMNKSVRVVYHIDILSGACCAYVKCGESVLYSFVGQCAASIPITGDSWANVLNGAISIAGAIGTMVATGGMSAPMSIGQIAATSVNAIKPSVEKSGAMAGTGGLMAIQTPYIILTRPRQAAPRDQNKYLGYPSFINELLGDLSGYTEVESVHLENVPATESELSEIETLLKGGVIF